LPGKTPTMAHDIFISYSSKDKTTADAACAALESRGMRCWIAPRDVFPGEEYAASLVRALHESRVMVLVFSSGANRSPQVLREVERAVSRGVPILPLRIEDVPPSEAMEYYISSRHWLDALNPPLEQHLVRLAETVKFLLSSEGDHASSHQPEPAVQVVGTLRDFGAPGGASPTPKTHPLAPQDAQPIPNPSSMPTGKFASTSVILISLVAVLCIAIVVIAIVHFHSPAVTTRTDAQSGTPAAPRYVQPPAALAAAQPSNSAPANSSSASPEVNSRSVPTSSAAMTSPMQQYMKGLGYYDSGQYAPALPLFQQAAAQGNANAQNHLGLMYMNGFGVRTDYAQALSWYNKAAAQGNYSGECNLGIMYDRGLGVPKDKVTAYMWYLLATQSGSPLAPKNARILAPQLTPQQLNEAQRRANALKARQK
jgi:tetratricopeptide (TPR) repeat protein